MTAANPTSYGQPGRAGQESQPDINLLKGVGYMCSTFYMILGDSLKFPEILFPYLKNEQHSIYLRQSL